MTHVLLTEEAFVALAGAITPADGTTYAVQFGETALIDGIGEVKSVAVYKISGDAPSVPDSDGCGCDGVVHPDDGLCDCPDDGDYSCGDRSCYN